MRIVVNHLTRMHGGHICVAGWDVDTRRHVRPVLQDYGMPFHFLARYGGPFDVARVVDLGNLRPAADPPHVEDYIYVPSWARVERTATAYEFWSVLEELACSRLRDVFGPALRKLGRASYGTDLGQGDASLACLRPRDKPELFLATSRDGKPRVRMKLGDGEILSEAPVTDLRLHEADHTTPDAARIRGVAKWIEDSEGVILSVGLTRKFRVSQQQDYFHWLQVNNLHLKEDPTWALG